ncbi:NADH-quinone oxidoreductase subunit J [Mangrovihabitans endophyticus]|uniref:NADH-quinone oxidoreductase subunit J n=1 Tax=Mangrovihabitans endophyticus TaxID=1751298 RepID=A0A8J3C409_9ACTN|nr:NADH-quinone oxidoreductase subunit J [Mangrovihabitans endophyticus]GGL07369.1 hypothetical protein GCM10012284_47080 [Mangrovihabitans endophyticus]
MRVTAFVLLALLAVAGGVAVFVVNSMARATIALAVSFVAAGAAILLVDAAYLGVITILMMLMEMGIMAIFMIMFMMNPGGLMPMSMMHNKRGALVVSIVVFLLLAGGALGTPWPQRRGTPPSDPTLALGEAIMGGKMLVMMTVSAVLFATIVSAMVLATGRGRYDGEPSARPADDA